jgi:hypothetical protein
MANDLPATTKVFPDNPTMHANAHARATFIFRDCLGIVPSSGIDWNVRHALAEMPLPAFKRAPH